MSVRDGRACEARSAMTLANIRRNGVYAVFARTGPEATRVPTVGRFTNAVPITITEERNYARSDND
jgi:hypothetical protein